MSLKQNHQVSVLVVDHEVATRRQIHDLLLTDGYGCRAVATAPAAQLAVTEKAPDLLICDVELGHESGLELYGRIKQSVDCPAIFLSDSRTQDTVLNARRAGGTYFLSKPFDPTVLMELVDKALWMPHLVRRHVDSAAHPLKAPSFAPADPRRSDVAGSGDLSGIHRADFFPGF